MSESPASIIAQVSVARKELAILVSRFSADQAAYKPKQDSWSTNALLEHLVLAKMSGVSKIWSAANGVLKGTPVWAGEHTNKGRSIDEIIMSTWKPKEVAPPIATPHFGGPLSYWLEFFITAQILLEKLEQIFRDLSLDSVIFPHFLCGPLDAG